MQLEDLSFWQLHISLDVKSALVSRNICHFCYKQLANVLMQLVQQFTSAKKSQTVYYEFQGPKRMTKNNKKKWVVRKNGDVTLILFGLQYTAVNYVYII